MSRFKTLIKTIPGAQAGFRRAVRLRARLVSRLLAVRRRRDRKAIEAAGLFDRGWYVIQYPDVAAAGLDPLDHYLTTGGFEGRNPNPRFDSQWYLEENPDVVSSRLNPLIHYIRHGAAEGRSPSHVDDAKIERFLSGVRERDTFRAVMDDGPLVSVVLATRDRRDEVQKAIRSVIAQSYRNWELLVVDDGSTDGTADAIEREFPDPRVRLLRSEPKGVSSARNAGLAQARGEFIAYLDSDNVWTPEFLAIALSHLIESEADFAYAGVQCQIDEHRYYFRFKPFDPDKFAARNFIDLNVILHRRWLYDSRGGFDEDLRRMVDWDLMIRYTRDARVAFAPFIGAIYDDSERADRITKKEGLFWKYVILNKHRIDWKAVAEGIPGRDRDLVSIVIPVYGQAELTDQCLTSLFSHAAGARFEVVIVDNGSDEGTAGLLDAWAARRPEIRVVQNDENLNFALGCNIGFAASRGNTIVFLNNDTLLSDGWLSPLVDGLNRAGIGAVQPKLTYPDGTIQCIGVTFSRHSAIGYPVYANHPATAPYVNASTERQAVTAACMAVRAADFVELGGFDTRYINGQEDVDFCLRLKERKGLACWYAAESHVVHQESKTPGRGLHIKANRRLFQERWADRIAPDDIAIYNRDGFRVMRWDVDNRMLQPEGLASYRPRLVPRTTAANDGTRPLRFALKIGCPTPAEKEEWGDYHMARSLGIALERLGCRYRIDFLKEWDTVEEIDDVNLVFRGLSEFVPPEGALNLMWLISHPDKVTVAELARFDHVFVASTPHAEHLASELGDRVSPLLQCTDPSLFHPMPTAEKRYDALFVGNSRNVFRHVVKDAIEQGVNIAIFGTRWRQFIPPRIIRGENIPNADLGRHYNAARVVLNDHWPDMRERGFVSNRIFDVLGCGVPLVSDEVAALPADLRPFVIPFGDEVPLKEAVETAMSEDSAARQGRIDFAAEVHRRHSFDHRAQAIVATVQSLLRQVEDGEQRTRVSLQSLSSAG